MEPTSPAGSSFDNQLTLDAAIVCIPSEELSPQNPREVSLPDPANRRLNSWKEIAEYCGRNVRTMLRWEKDRGLPAHRIPGGGRVFAYTAELEQWLRSELGSAAGINETT